MIQQITSIFDKTLSSKLTFGIPIRVKNSTQSEPVWIDSISKVRDQYLVDTSNRKDKAILNLKTLDTNALASLHERMIILFGKKIKAEMVKPPRHRPISDSKGNFKIDAHENWIM